MNLIILMKRNVAYTLSHARERMRHIAMITGKKLEITATLFSLN